MRRLRRALILCPLLVAAPVAAFIASWGQNPTVHLSAAAVDTTRVFAAEPTRSEIRPRPALIPTTTSSTSTAPTSTTTVVRRPPRPPRPHPTTTTTTTTDAPQPAAVPSGPVTGPRDLGQQMAAAVGWTGEQWTCLDSLWGQHESGWNPRLYNRAGSGAYGIPQALPGSKMGPGWQTDPVVQIRWGLGYIRSRYRTPCGALAVRIRQGSY